MEAILTEEEATLVMSILVDNLIDLKNSPTGFDDYGTTKDLENAVNKLDAWFIEVGYADE
jgi:hypothetical protein